jgi:hypothetical protein
LAGASGHGHAIERANRGCVASGVPQAMGTIRDEFAPSSARAPHERVGQRPRTSVGPVVQLKRLSARAKTHFALDPFCAGFAAEEPLASSDPAQARPRDHIHIIVTKSGDLKVLQRQSALLRRHCDPATTLDKTMG